MPALNFQNQFADAVQDGIKRQSVRAHRKDGRPIAKRGDELKLYTGMRSKACRLLGIARVICVVPVTIEATGMKLNGRYVPSSILTRDQIEQTDNEFAQADGFANFMEMSAWFDKTHGLPFDGVVINWDNPHG